MSDVKTCEGYVLAELMQLKEETAEKDNLIEALNKRVGELERFKYAVTETFDIKYDVGSGDINRGKPYIHAGCFFPSYCGKAEREDGFAVIRELGIVTDEQMEEFEAAYEE